ncbi:unnamed protein product, partial [Heterosigma akashiwo]
MSDEEKASRIAQVVFEAFDALKAQDKRIDFGSGKWTVLASFVLEDTHTGEMVPCAMATGNKCIGRSMMKEDGSVINDCHAEVMARRAFIGWLLDEVLYLKMAEQRVEERTTGPVGAVSPLVQVADNKYSLKENMRVHFYVSEVPCGDANIYDSVLSHHQSSYPLKQESSESTLNGRCVVIPHEKTQTCTFTGAKLVKYLNVVDESMRREDEQIVGAVRLKPGRHDLQMGSRSISMSCSDKIARWVALGLQGGLLSTFVNHVSLSSVVVSAAAAEEGGQPGLHQALQRALWDRLQPLLERSNVSQ